MPGMGFWKRRLPPICLLDVMTLSALGSPCLARQRQVANSRDRLQSVWPQRRKTLPGLDSGAGAISFGWVVLARDKVVAFRSRYLFAHDNGRRKIRNMGSQPNGAAVTSPQDGTQGSPHFELDTSILEMAALIDVHNHLQHYAQWSEGSPLTAKACAGMISIGDHVVSKTERQLAACFAELRRMKLDNRNQQNH